MIEAVRPRVAGRLPRVEAEAREARVALAALEQQQLAELAHVAQEDLRPAVLETKLQVGVGVGSEIALGLGREGRPPRRREQPGARRRAREQLSGHAEVDDEPDAVVELRHQIFAATAERRDATPPEPSA